MALWSTLLVGFVASFVLGAILDNQKLARHWGGTALRPDELNDLRVGIVTGALLVVCVGWFALCTVLAHVADRSRTWSNFGPDSAPKRSGIRVTGLLALFEDTPERRAHVDAFFAEMNTPIDDASEHRGQGHESDRRQYHVLGALSFTFGAFLATLAALPNTPGGRLGLLFCGGSVAVVGVVLYAVARRKSVRILTPTAPPSAPGEMAMV
jgi:hypothetical protein